MKLPFTPVLSLVGLAIIAVTVSLFVLSDKDEGSITEGFIGIDGSHPPMSDEWVPPDPPKEFQAFDKSFQMASMVNPYITTSYNDEVYEDGRRIYYKKCVFCHGAALNGKGRYAQAMDPSPSDFLNSSIRPRLTQPYLFWRIAKGGTAHDASRMAWRSQMPAWEGRLDEDEIWKVAFYIHTLLAKSKEGYLLEPDQNATAKDIYKDHCAPCHGNDGDGKGLAANLFSPKPRQLKLGFMKFRTTQGSQKLPSDDDLHSIIADGLTGTGMPAWRQSLTDEQIKKLVHLVKELGDVVDLENDPTIADYVPPSPLTEEEKRQSPVLFQKKCERCHGKDGRGDVIERKKLADDWGDRVWPRNLARPDTFRWAKDLQGIYRVLTLGVDGTPMPSFVDELSPRQRWAMADYIFNLSKQSNIPLPTNKRQVILAETTGEKGVLAGYEDPAWKGAIVTSIPMLPNFQRSEKAAISLNDTLSVSAMHDGETLVLRVTVDDRTMSVPGHHYERRQALKKVEPYPDAFAVIIPDQAGEGGIIPLLGMKTGGVYYWRAKDPLRKEREIKRKIGSLDILRTGDIFNEPTTNVEARWTKGQWQFVFRLPLKTIVSPSDKTGRYLPIAFANWDGLLGQRGDIHMKTAWNWVYIKKADEKS